MTLVYDQVLVCLRLFISFVSIDEMVNKTDTGLFFVFRPNKMISVKSTFL